MKNVSLTFSIQVSGLKCHYEQYFPPAQPLLPGGGFCATSSVFPFPLPSIKICISVCICSAKLVPFSGSASLGKGRMALDGPEGGSAPSWQLLRWPVEALLQLWPDQASALPDWCSLAEFRLKVCAPATQVGPAGWGRGSPPSSYLRPASVLRASGCPAQQQPAPGISAGSAGLFWPREER